MQKTRKSRHVSVFEEYDEGKSRKYFKEWAIFSQIFRKRKEQVTPSDITQKRLKEGSEFGEKIHTRSDFLLDRIARPKELADKLIARSESPNSTVSTNIAEFLRLRGFLVDIRYAQNGEAEAVAFENMYDWLDTAKDKPLWLKLLDEIGFSGLENAQYYP